MTDPSELPKLIDSKVAQRAYEDAGAGALRETGSLAVDTVKAFRLFTAPIQLLAMAQDRFARWLEEVRRSIPEERQKEAAPEIAGPALMNLRFLPDEHVLARLYLNLLKRAIDKDYDDTVHPGFIKVLEQLSPREALLLHRLRKTTLPTELVPIRHNVPCVAAQLILYSTTYERYFSDWSKEQVRSSTDVIEGLALLTSYRVPSPDPHRPELLGGYDLTQFGRDFLTVCLPENDLELLQQLEGS